MAIKQGWTGRVFEDFEVGDIYEHPLGRTVLAADNIWFTLLTQNTNPIHFEMVRTNYPLLRHFHDCVLSYEAGAVKPSSKIFQTAIQRAQCKPEECFFTDDILINIEAARKHGMDAVQFHTSARLEEELRARRIL